MSQATTSSGWDRRLKEIRRRVNQRQFWQDVAAAQVQSHALEKNAGQGGDSLCESGEGSEEQGTKENGKESTRVGTFVRWWRFNFVGGIGIAVQFAALFLLKSIFHLNYLAATGLAVEIAVLHNFVWHERFTWVDRLAPRGEILAGPSGAEALMRRNGFIAALKRCANHNLRGSSFARLARFHLANGAVSILGNLALMKIMVGEGHMNYLAANAIAIVICSLANFLLSDRWVFES